MKKIRILSLMLCFALLFALCSCNGKKNTDASVKSDLELLKAAVDKTDNCNSFQMEATNKISCTVKGEETTTESDILVQGELDENGKPKMLFNTTTEVKELGEMSLNFSYVDSYVFMEILGQKIKVKADEKQADLILNENDGTALGLDIADVKDASASKEGDKTVYFINYNTDGLNKMLESTLSELEISATNAVYNSGYATVTVNAENMIEKISISVSATVTDAELGEIKIGYWMDVTYSKYNEKIGISAPGDADKYAEVKIDDVLKENATAA